MFKNPAKLANLIMIMTALALCVSACTGTKAGDFMSGTSLYDSGASHGSFAALAHFG